MIYNEIGGSVQFSSFTQSWPTLCKPKNSSMPGLPVHHQLQEITQLMYMESVMPSNSLILCRPLLLLPSIFPSIRAFSNEAALPFSWPKYWSFSFNIPPGKLPNPGIEPRSSTLQADALPSEPPGNPSIHTKKGYFPITGITNYWLCAPYCTIRPWAYLIWNSSCLPP